MTLSQSLQEQFSGITSIALDLLTSKSYASLVHIRGTTPPEWILKMQYILLFQRYHKQALDKNALRNDDLDAFVESINYTHDILQSPTMSEDIKAILQWLYRTQIRSIFRNKRIKARLFCKRDAMPKKNPLRTFFLVDYINEEVYALLNNAEENNKVRSLAVSVSAPANISELENSQMEYERCFDVLCRAYGEDDLKELKNENAYMPQNLPVELRQALKDYYDALWGSLDTSEAGSPEKKPSSVFNGVKPKKLLN